MTKIRQKTGFGKFVLVVLVILLAVSVSGCKGKAKECPVVVSQTDAIKILSFSSGYEDVPVGGSVHLSMDLQNGGNYEATDIQADLWSHPGFGIGGDTQQFKTVPTLYPPDLSICSEGDAYSVQWDMQAGCDPRESIVAASVSYMYKSEGWASILLMSQQEAERLGGQTSGTGENFPSAGPVQIEIESLRNQPLIISENARSFSIRLKIQNTGDGLAGYKGSGYMNETTLTLSGPCEFVPDSPISLERENYDAYTQGSSKVDPWAESSVDCSDQPLSGFQLQSCVIPQCDCDLGLLYTGSDRDELEDTDCNGYENPTKTVSVGTPPAPQTIAMEIGDRCWDVYQPSMVSTALNYAVFTTTGDEENNKELTYADADLQLRFGKQDLIKTLSLKYTGKMDFVKDFCTISVVSNYGYRVTEQLKGKFGIYGSSDEITNCRDQLTT